MRGCGGKKKQFWKEIDNVQRVKEQSTMGGTRYKQRDATGQGCCEKEIRSVL